MKTLAVVALVIAILGIFVWRTAIRPAKATPSFDARPGGNNDNAHQGAMDEDRFWKLIGETHAFEADTERQAAALRESLAELPPAEIERFEQIFEQTMRSSYSWDLWGAAYVVHGGASDDGFEYFRCWLISKGRDIFQQVAANPDSLADVLAAEPGGPLEFEEFAYIARDVWGEKTGKEPSAMPQAANMIYPSREPSGTPFSEEPSELAERYPKLWKRFGANPIE